MVAVTVAAVVVVVASTTVDPATMIVEAAAEDLAGLKGGRQRDVAASLPTVQTHGSGASAAHALCGG